MLFKKGNFCLIIDNSPIFWLSISEFQSHEGGRMNSNLELCLEPLDGSRIVDHDEERDFFDPEMSACFVPLGTRALRKLCVGQMVWVDRAGPFRRSHAFEFMQICSIEKHPNGTKGILLRDMCFDVNPRRPNGMLLRLIAPRRLAQLITESNMTR